MIVRSIGHEEIDFFAQTSREGNTERFREWVSMLWSDNESSPDSCFIALDNALPIGRVGYWSLPSSRHEAVMMGLSITAEHDRQQIGIELVRESLRQIGSQGVRRVENHVRSTSNSYQLFSEIMEQGGWSLLQEKCRYIYDVENRTIERRHGRLRFRSLDEVGEEEFIAAIRSVSIETLDRQISGRISEAGNADAARGLFNDLSDLDHNPAWWQLAYDERNDLVGLVVPQKLDPLRGAINYIGVIPQKRGHGYVDDLLAEGMQILGSATLQQVVADIDIDNAPMRAALDRGGFGRDYSFRVYCIEIAEGSGRVQRQDGRGVRQRET